MKKYKLALTPLLMHWGDVAGEVEKTLLATNDSFFVLCPLCYGDHFYVKCENPPKDIPALDIIWKEEIDE